jgi:lipopolysaccharide/colanic/teichoic acid biosynthesis glycosyltransferase
MFGQAGTELDRRNDFDAPQIVSKCDDARSGLRHITGIKIVENSVVRQLSPIDFTPHSARIQPWKRMLDVCCVLIAIPCLLPLILSIAALIKLSTKGPILFKQRIGLLGRKFIVCKFHTVIMGADTAAHALRFARLMEAMKLSRQKDRRLIDKGLIPVGRLLPQLINVLGVTRASWAPNPCLPTDDSRYLLWQKERLHAWPGLTALWQGSGKNRLTFG